MSSLNIPDIGAGILLCLYLSLTSDIMQRAQSIPASTAFCIEWPRYLVSLLARKNPPPAHDWPSTVINVKSGYARTNRSATLEHLLQSHASTSATKRGLTVTFLYTSDFPGWPGADAVRWSALATAVVQTVLAWGLNKHGVASSTVVSIVVAGTCLSFLCDCVMLYQQRKELGAARAVSHDQHDVILITSGNGSSDVVVVVTNAGGAKIEDMAAARGSSLNAFWIIVVAVLLALWSTLLVAFSRLEAIDAWSVLGIAALGTTHAMYAARTWRGPSALGFKFSEACTTVVHEAKVMQTLMRAEQIESGVGFALLPVFFPGPLRPREEEWWSTRRGLAKSM